MSEELDCTTEGTVGNACAVEGVDDTVGADDTVGTIGNADLDCDRHALNEMPRGLTRIELGTTLSDVA